MLKKIKADLHIHSCLSPCGDIQMSPVGIVLAAKEKGLDLIAVSDHNSSENTYAAIETGKKNGIKVFAGMEVNSREEVHVLGIFEDAGKIQGLQKAVYEKLEGENDDETFGYQMVVNADDEITELNERLLIGATTLSVNEIADLIHQLGGLAIASHVDRERFSLIGQLGFLPPDLKIDAMELSPAYMEKTGKYEFPLSSGLPLVTFSDAHFLHDIGRTFTTFNVEDISLEEIKKALENRDGRSVAAYS